MYANLLEEMIVPVSSSVEPLTHKNQSTDVLDIALTSDKQKKRYVYAIINKDPVRTIELGLDFESMGKKQSEN